MRLLKKKYRKVKDIDCYKASAVLKKKVIKLAENCNLDVDELKPSTIIIKLINYGYL